MTERPRKRTSGHLRRTTPSERVRHVIENLESSEYRNLAQLRTLSHAELREVLAKLRPHDYQPIACYRAISAITELLQEAPPAITEEPQRQLVRPMIWRLAVVGITLALALCLYH